MPGTYALPPPPPTPSRGERRLWISVVNRDSFTNHDIGNYLRHGITLQPIRGFPSHSGGHGNTINDGDSQTSLSPFFSEGMGASVHRLFNSSTWTDESYRVSPREVLQSWLINTVYHLRIRGEERDLKDGGWQLSSPKRRLVGREAIWKGVLDRRLQYLYTAFSKKPVGKSARDNPERYCGWFWVHCSSKKVDRMAGEAMDSMFASAKGKQQK